MKLTRRNSIISIFLLLSIFLTGWSIILSKKNEPHAITQASSRPDVIIEEVKAIIMNKDGTPILKVETPRLVHFTENDAAELTRPHVTIYRHSAELMKSNMPSHHSPEPWHINSNFAKTKKGIGEITFWDHVVINHPADIDNPITTMQTNTLTIFPEQQIVKTDDAVVMTQPATIIHAIGMLANWNDGTVKLLSQAREEYVP